MRRTLLAATSLAILIGACGGPMTPTEYVDGLNALMAERRAEFETAVIAYGQIEEPSFEESVQFMETEVAIRRAVLADFDTLDPPESLSDVHQALRDALARLLAAAEGLLAVADTVVDLEEAGRTPEFAEYDAANADGNVVCEEVQAQLDDLAAAGQVFADTPWISAEVGLAVRAVLGCGEIETG